MSRRVLCALLSFVTSCTLYFYTYDKKAPRNFSQAKTIAIAIHKGAPTFYCGCPIIWQGKKGKPDLVACGYQPRKNRERAQRIEWEHVVPAWDFGHLRLCWIQGGRAACEQQDPLFNRMAADLHNLQPVIGEVNGDRKNFPFTTWPEETHQYGACTIKIDFARKKIDPPMRSRGAIARTYLYMRDRYQLEYDTQFLALLHQWHNDYPVSAWECQRDAKIAKHQGNHNPYVAVACKEGSSH